MADIPNSMNVSDTFNVADSHEYQVFNQDENLGSKYLEVEEKVKTSKALMYGAPMRASDSSTQTFVFDPGIVFVSSGQRHLFITT
jgi:hypothetical protein